MLLRVSSGANRTAKHGVVTTAEVGELAVVRGHVGFGVHERNEARLQPLLLGGTSFPIIQIFEDEGAQGSVPGDGGLILRKVGGIGDVVFHGQMDGLPALQQTGNVTSASGSEHVLGHVTRAGCGDPTFATIVPPVRHTVEKEEAVGLLGPPLGRQQTHRERLAHLPGSLRYIKGTHGVRTD